MYTHIRNPRGQHLDATHHLAEGDRRGTLVIGHGVTANKDREWAVVLANAAAKAGFDALRFSFAGNGASGGSFLDSFPSSEAIDLGAVVDAVQGAGRGPVTYVGHSMGAAVGVLQASVDPRITRLVSLGGMVHTADFVRRKFEGLAPGALMWDKPECPISQAFLDDMARVGSVLPVAPRIRVPWLLVHGDADAVVPVDESREIAAKAGGPAKVVVLPGADHVFTDAAELAASRVVDWLKGA